MKSRLRSRPGLKRPLALLALSLCSASPLYPDIAIVTGRSTPVDSIDEAQAKALWLGTIERVDGNKLAVADRDDAEIRAEFYGRVLSKSPGQVKAIRAKRAFQYGIAPPPKFPDDKSVLAWVRGLANRLGYVDAEALDDSVDHSVKVLLLIKVPERSQRP